MAEKRFSPIDIQKALHGAGYPAKAKDLAALARRNGADDRIVEMIEKSGQEQFDRPSEVQKAIFHSA
ncbi:hypothetical protein AQ490_17470 [Wenjunlia vitaminophila]|uniref:DUF2795 domain-containing protein n=1 Tax=Wenjunlia vitaminophila TaxID=76728 RepID=A0A0T6LW02_WENVI|nr:DUF2795 domain-containing protein [Wenjunlia vitaminophila]KRV50018.1 hypothetical protein AQ490_17470 [Wenjunlia vitaminophila]